MFLSTILNTITALFFCTCYALDSSADFSSCLGYAVRNVKHEKWKIEADLDLVGRGCAVYGPDVPKLRLLVEYETDSRLHVLIQDRKGQRYQVPEHIIPRPAKTLEPPASGAESFLSFTFENRPFSFRVARRDTGEVLFDTFGTQLIFERQFLRLKTWLPPDPNIYGLGEHTDTFRLPNKDYVRTLWARDSGAVPYGENLYGSHPIYFEHRRTGTHGVFLLNSNGMDIRLDREPNGKHYLEYAVIGGVFDLYFLAGPRPRDVARQYAKLVGKPAMVPYWSLGFHQCKFGYQDWFHVAEVVHNYSAAGIPLETMWTDIDYMDHRKSFSLDPERFPRGRMQQLVRYLHDRQQHYIMMVDPAIAESSYRPYTRGVEMDVFMKAKDSSLPFRGVVWPGVTVFPDWYHANASGYWIERFKEMFDPDSGVNIDGVWIDMNEPANMCDYPCKDPDEEARKKGFPPTPPPLRKPPRQIPGFPETETVERDRLKINHNNQYSFGPLHTQIVSDAEEIFGDFANSGADEGHEGDNLLDPPYKIHNHASDGALSSHTMDTNLRHSNGLWAYDTHNLYGTIMSMFTRAAMLARRPGLRPFVVTRSTFAGAGRYVAKWLGDNVSRGDHYRASIAGMLGFASVYQVPMVGSDVCGFLESSTEKLCARWATLGAFSPFFRNHADINSRPQEFYRWPLVASAAKYAISIRYRLLDYLYTALQKQSQDGTPAINPIFYLYPQDERAFAIDLQYFYGNCVLVSPVTDDDATSVRMYLPDDIFYELETQKPIRGRADWIQLKEVPFDRIPLHIRGGCIVPLRASSANTTTEVRKKGFELLVAPGLDGRAQGSLYVDDGKTLDGGPKKTEVVFNYGDGKLETVVTEGFVGLEEAGVHVEKVTILGGAIDEKNENWIEDEL